MTQYIYPQNLKATANLWLWGLRDFVILAVTALLSVLALVQLRIFLPAAAVLCYGFLTIRMDDTTVLTMLGVLHKKDLVAFRQEGRAFIYRPTLTKTEVRDRALHNLMAQLFDGSPDALAVHLLEHHDIDPARIDALRDKVRRARPKASIR